MLENTPPDPFATITKPEAFDAAPGRDPFGPVAGMSPVEADGEPATDYNKGCEHQRFVPIF